jgi:hypothetical protein
MAISSASDTATPNTCRACSDTVVMGEELRTYGIGAVVVLILGVAAGFGLHHFVDGPRAKAATAVIAKQDAPDPALSCPPPQRTGPPINDTSASAALSDTQHPPERKSHPSKKSRVR